MAERQLNQAELAAKLGVEPPYVSMILSGKKPITYGIIGRFAKAFGFEVAAELFGDDCEESAEEQKVEASA